MSPSARNPRHLLAHIPASLQGVGLALISTFLFVLVAVLVRRLSDHINLFEILLFRQLVFITLLLPAINNNLQTLLKPQHIGLHSLRITGAFAALYLGFVTVSNLPLADATALGFCQVLFVALIARIFLAENLNLNRLLTLLPRQQRVSTALSLRTSLPQGRSEASGTA